MSYNSSDSSNINIHSNIELQPSNNNRASTTTNPMTNTTCFSKLLNLCTNKSPTTNTSRKLIFNQNGNYEAPLIREEDPYINNKIKTSKYSLLTFIPLNLFEQVIRPANFYFCIIAVLQAIPEFSISAGTPTILLPLTFVFAVTALKDALEDLV